MRDINITEQEDCVYLASKVKDLEYQIVKDRFRSKKEIEYWKKQYAEFLNRRIR